jgi:peptidoglycan/xylan/chitin deacetylase (PgdA/CDA1 family)
MIYRVWYNTRFLILLCSILFLIFSCKNSLVKKEETFSSKNKDSLHTIPKLEMVDSSLIKFNRKPIVYDSNKTYVYLTFDDGPQPGTIETFNICKKQGIKASYFMVGRHANDNWGQQIVAMIRDAYPQFLLANHSYTHASERYQYFYQHPLISVPDFFKAQESLHVPYKIVRLPGNNAWVINSKIKSSKLVQAVCKKLDSAGYNIIGWDVEWNFSKGNSYPIQTPSKLASEVNYSSRNKKHIVILTHDRMFRTPAFSDSLNKFINILKQNPKYTFETVDNYPNLKF